MAEILDVMRAVGRLRQQDTLIVNVGPGCTRWMADRIKESFATIGVDPGRVIVLGAESVLVVEGLDLRPVGNDDAAELVADIGRADPRRPA